MTVFIRLLDASVDEKAATLRSAVGSICREAAQGDPLHSGVFERLPTQFATVPGSPFPYWANSALLSAFSTNGPFASDGRMTRQGLATANDLRFLRCWWEITSSLHWSPFAKGGRYSPFYYDLDLVLHWTRGNTDALELKAFAESTPNTTHWSRRIPCVDLYFRRGLTWPLRSQRGLSVRVLPAGSIFGQKGSAAFIPNDSESEAFACLAIINSVPFKALVSMQMAFGAYDVGVIARTPIPSLEATANVGALARRAWSLKHSIDTVNETSHAFLLPAGLNERITGLNKATVEAELARIQQQIDDRAFELYGIGAEDRAVIESSIRVVVEPEVGAEEGTDEENEEEIETADAGQTAAVVSWLVGVAFGRFDPRLATGERAVPPEPEPFDPLPPRSPGMWPEGPAPKDAPDILVDDEGHPSDLAARVKQAAEQVRWQPPEDLRTWLAREFFPLHIKMYSKSRRKAPIYWQLATPSGSYSLWLYLHAFTRDTLFRVQHEYAGPKLLHEEHQLESLRREFGDSPARTERQRIADQESFVEELRAFLEEVKRVAPLWNTNLDDGVIINFAPLWRLVPHCKSWQKESKATWDALCAGQYDWAHLAMHLWPERVVPKCAKDRSLAIAHGLEEVFWVENDEEKSVARPTPTRSIEEIVRERTSPAVRAALDSLLQAPVAQNGGRRSRNRRARATGSA